MYLKKLLKGMQTSFILLAPSGAHKTDISNPNTYSFECSEPFNDDLKHSKTLKRYWTDIRQTLRQPLRQTLNRH